MNNVNLSEVALIRHGVALFNRGKFFECHEVLEQVWLNAQQERKLFLQGLIQIAVGLYHLRRNNTVGAERLLSAGVNKLQTNDVGPSWIDSASLIADVRPLLLSIQEGAALTNTPLPQIRLSAQSDDQLRGWPDVL